MTELFSIVGFYTGWRAQHGTSYNASATFDGHPWDSGDRKTIEEAERAFYAAARWAFIRKYLGKLGLTPQPPRSGAV